MMKIVQIGYVVSDYSLRLLDALVRSAREAKEPFWLSYFASPANVIAERGEKHCRNADALVIELRPVISPSINFPQDDEQNFAKTYGDQGFPLIVLYDSRDASQCDIAENMIMTAPRALVLDKSRGMPSPQHFDAKIIPSIINKVTEWKALRGEEGAEISEMPSVLRPQRTTTGTPCAILAFPPR